jgi:hypothetical protein
MDEHDGNVRTRYVPRTGDAVVFDGHDVDWVWLDTVPFDEEIGGEDMLVWHAGEIGLIISEPMSGDGYKFVKILISTGIGYYYADQVVPL